MFFFPGVVQINFDSAACLKQQDVPSLILFVVACGFLLFIIAGVCLTLTFHNCGCGILGLTVFAVFSIAWITMRWCPYIITSAYLDGTMSITQLADYDQELFILKEGEALVDRWEIYQQFYSRSSHRLDHSSCCPPRDFCCRFSAQSHQQQLLCWNCCGLGNLLFLHTSGLLELSFLS